MTRLRRVSPSERGWGRRRAGSGFVYLDAEGNRLPVADAERCRQLVIPPAWTDVWICSRANGHLQAVGTDDAGRRQYLYHPAWRQRRDEEKFVRVRRIARRLPAARRRAAVDLRRQDMPRERALATAFALLDLGLFRVGGESYAEDNGSFGLATLAKSHVTISDGMAVFEYGAKSGIDRTVAVDDAVVVAAVSELRRRRGGGAELLAYRGDDRRWHDVDSAAINQRIKELLGEEASAKDFRTWHGTVGAAVALAERHDPAASVTARKKAIRESVVAVADDLGNTPTVARSSYIDPLVIDHFEHGETIAGTLARLSPRMSDGRRRDRIERAVLRLLA